MKILGFRFANSNDSDFNDRVKKCAVTEKQTVKYPKTFSCLAEFLMDIAGLAEKIPNFVISPGTCRVLIQKFIGHQTDISFKSIKQAAFSTVS